MRIDLNSPLLTTDERRTLQRIAERLRRDHGRQPPQSYQRQIDHTFGGCDSDSGDLDQRGPRK